MEIWKRSMIAPTPFGPTFQQRLQRAVAGPRRPRSISTRRSRSSRGRPRRCAFSRVLATASWVSPSDTCRRRKASLRSPERRRGNRQRTDSGELAPNVPRTIALGFPGARGAVLNVALTLTEGASGWVAAFPANITWPGNSSVNWAAPNPTIANGVITAMIFWARSHSGVPRANPCHRGPHRLADLTLRP